MKEWRLKVKSFYRRLLGIYQWKEPPSPLQSNLLHSLREAHRDWLFARTYFHCVIDPDLIDYAIFSMDAAEQKYSYLLKQARETRVKIPYTLDKPGTRL